MLVKLFGEAAAVTRRLCKTHQLTSVIRPGDNMHPALTYYLSLFDFAENSSDEMKRSREDTKKMLLRKLSFRPTVEELKSRKVRPK